MNRFPLVCLMGPTASGKTQIAVQLVQQFPFEIISVDSAMVYRDMDIGTAKPSADIVHRAPHQLINLIDPSETYSAAQFCKDAMQAINDIQGHHKIPLLVGGTMLYFRALLRGMADLPSANQAIRQQLEQEAMIKGWPAMHEKLKHIDPEAAEKIYPQDSQRIQRALEVFMVSGKKISVLQKESGALLQAVQPHCLIVAPDNRAVLHERIALRFHQMLAEGLVDEVKQLYDRGDLTGHMPAMRSVGYRQVWQYLSGELTHDNMIEHGIIATRQLAKRQLTWLRAWPDAVWFNSESEHIYSELVHYVKRHVLRHFNEKK